MNGTCTLSWSINRTANSLISGYFIYLQEINAENDTLEWRENLLTPYNDVPYPGDTDGDNSKESFQLSRLTNGVKHFALIRTVGVDGRQSAPSNVVMFTPLGKGEFTLSANHLSSAGGFNFENGMAVPARDPRNDIYLYATETRIGLSSPNRLAAGLRRTRISLVGDGLSDGETVVIHKGMRLKLRTKFGRAEISIEEIIGRYPDISARISYIYYPGNH